MNDPQFVEAARHLATVTLKSDNEDKFDEIYSRAMGIQPDDRVRSILKNTYGRVLPAYVENPDAAKQLLNVGDSPVDESIDSVELAAWTIIANQVMNLDALITKN